MNSIWSERQRLDPNHGGKIERRVEMREERPAARLLPFQVPSKTPRIDRQKHEPGLAGEMSGEGVLELVGGGKMDEAVADIVGGAGEAPLAPGLGEGLLGQDFIDRLCHGSPPRD